MTRWNDIEMIYKNTQNCKNYYNDKNVELMWETNEEKLTKNKGVLIFPQEKSCDQKRNAKKEEGVMTNRKITPCGAADEESMEGEGIMDLRWCL